MSRIAVSLALVMTDAVAAQAQTQRFSDAVQALENQAPPRPPAVSERAPLRVQVSYQLQEPSDRTMPLDAQKDSLEAAHAQLYRVIGQECEVISRTFGGECRVVSVNVGNGGQSYGPVPLTTYTASAVFEVAAPAASPPKPR